MDAGNLLKHAEWWCGAVRDENLGDPADTVPSLDELPKELEAADELVGLEGNLYEYVGLESVVPPTDLVVEVARYLGAVGLGGLIGNRADAVTLRAVRRLFRSVRRRWRRRASDSAEPLTIEEAIDAARAAAGARSYRIDTIEIVSARREGHVWRVELCANDRKSNQHFLLIRIPWGDPADATIKIAPWRW